MLLTQFWFEKTHRLGCSLWAQAEAVRKKLRGHPCKLPDSILAATKIKAKLTQWCPPICVCTPFRFPWLLLLRLNLAQDCFGKRYTQHCPFFSSVVIQCIAVLNSVITLQLQLWPYLNSVCVQGGGKWWSSLKLLRSGGVDIIFLLHKKQHLHKQMLTASHEHRLIAKLSVCWPQPRGQILILK